VEHPHRRETKADRIRRKLNAITQDDLAFTRLVLAVVNEIRGDEPYRTKRAIVVSGKWYPFELQPGETWEEAVLRLNPEPVEPVKEERRAAANE
jgi:hypothetical protein